MRKQNILSHIHGSREIKKFEIDYWCNYIICNYHSLIRQNFFSIKLCISTLSNLGENPEEINQLNIIYKKLNKCLENYIGKEEHILFTYIEDLDKQIKEGNYESLSDISLMDKPLQIIKTEQQKILSMIIQIRKLTDNYNTEVNWSPSHKNCYRLFSKLDYDLKEYFFMEETILVPRIKQMQKKILSFNN